MTDDPDEYDATAYTLTERLEVEVTEDEPTGVLLDHRGDVLAVIYPPRQPFGFQPPT